MKIKIEYSEDAVLGYDAQVIAELDIEQSLDNFEEMLWGYVEDRYQEAEIEIVRGINDRVTVDGDTDHPEVTWIEDQIELTHSGQWEAYR